jgi:hypothetical protein
MLSHGFYVVVNYFKCHKVFERGPLFRAKVDKCSCQCYMLVNFVHLINYCTNDEMNSNYMISQYGI